MAISGIGALRGSDEGMNHQLIDTFATVSQADLAWTEKIWCSMARTDGSLQVNFGLGKYHNRGIADGFGGVSRGREQWTVRGSRELGSAPEELSIGPLRYEIVEPLHRVRFQLEANEVQPISFDLELSSVTPPFFEDRNLTRNKATGRIDVDVIRYHQGGWVSGTVTVDGETHEVRPDEWFGFRDHSWGVRQGVGAPPTDVIPRQTLQRSTGRSGFKWTPFFLRRADGTYFEAAVHASEGVGIASAFLNDADGTQSRISAFEPHLRYDTHTRFVLGGELHLTTESGEKRIIEVERAGESGFFLRTAGYGSWGKHKHGAWMGPLHVDGEYIPDCWDDEHLNLFGQLRDTPLHVREGDAEGYGIMESMMTGVWPELGLFEDSDRRPDFL